MLLCNNLVILDSSESQSETVLKCLKFITVLNGPIVIHNIDTILYNRDYQKIKAILQNNDGFIDIFSSNNPNYSYVINSDNKIIFKDKNFNINLTYLYQMNYFIDNLENDNIYMNDINE